MGTESLNRFVNELLKCEKNEKEGKSVTADRVRRRLKDL